MPRPTRTGGIYMTLPVQPGTELRQQIGWVLRAFRRYSGTGVSMEQMTGWVPGSGTLSHRSQIFRWESGSSAPTWEAVQRYEEMLRLAPRQLAAAIDATARGRLPRHAAPWLARPHDDDQYAQAVRVLDLLDASAPMTGADWDDLTSTLVAQPVLLPTALWRRLLRRGLAEMSTSLGLEYALRAESMARLAAHKQPGALLVDAVAEAVADPGCAVFSEAITLLRFSNEVQAQRLLLELVATSQNPLVTRSALTTLASRHLSDGDDPPSPEERRLAVEALRRPDSTYRVRRAAGDLLHLAPQEARDRLAALLHQEGTEPAAVSVLRSGHALDAARRARLAEQVWKHLEDTLGRQIHEDPELWRRTQIALGDPNDEERAQMLVVFMLSPLAAPLAAALGQCLADAWAAVDVSMAQEALRPLTFLSGPAQLEVLLDVATYPADAAAHAEVAAEAAWALGNVVDVDAAGAELRDARLLDRLRRLVGGTPPVMPAHALVYALAMRGRTDLLEGLVVADSGLRAEVDRWCAPST